MIYTPKWDDGYPQPFHMEVPLPGVHFRACYTRKFCALDIASQVAGEIVQYNTAFTQRFSSWLTATNLFINKYTEISYNKAIVFFPIMLSRFRLIPCMQTR